CPRLSTGAYEGDARRDGFLSTNHAAGVRAIGELFGLTEGGPGKACAIIRTSGRMGIHAMDPPLCGSALGHGVDLHLTPMCAMLLTASERERYGTHTHAGSPLSQRPRHHRRQDQSWATTL